VIVIGGGLAGLSSAVALAEAGFRVRLFEKRPHLGGRAASYLLPDGSCVDNCQHVTLGCCTNLANFYRQVGAEQKIRFYDKLFFADAHGHRSTIRLSGLPEPFHLAPSFLGFSVLSWWDKFCIARAMLLVARSGGHLTGSLGMSMLNWLRREGQTARAIDRFWRVVLVSALDEELERTDARYGIDVFWKAFLANRNGFSLGIPSVPLGDLYDGCRGAIEQRGGEVHTRAGIRELRIAQGLVKSVILTDGSEVTDAAYILAVPHEAVLELVPAPVAEKETAFANVSQLHSAPITGVHLWFDRPVLDEPYLTLLEHTVQWIFNKTRLYDPPAADGGQYLQLVISASYGLVPRSRQEILDLCQKELREVLPLTREARIVKAAVIKEIAATFSPELGSDRWRPEQKTTIANLFLAGDWTRTGWPATMEGAVRSGYLAAEAVLATAGRPQKLLVPDLPAEGLCRRWARE